MLVRVREGDGKKGLSINNSPTPSGKAGQRPPAKGGAKRMIAPAPSPAAAKMKAKSKGMY